MTQALKFAACSGAAAPLYVDDVFSTWLYTGNGSTQTITNGIDLSGQGGLVWTKGRYASSHYLFDTARGVDETLLTNLTDASTALATGVTAFNQSGYSLGNSSSLNTNTNLYTSWSFAQAPKFFDVVTYTGDDSGGRAINHSLGQIPGMIIVKATSAPSGGAADWIVWHRSLTQGIYPSSTDSLRLNTTAAAASSTAISGGHTSTAFKLGSAGGVNVNGVSYVAYLFAHDPGTDGIIQCGSFTTDGSGNWTENLGWEPQYLMLKNSTGLADAWNVLDSMRGFVADKSSSSNKTLSPNTSSAETGNPIAGANASGFSCGSLQTSQTYIYLAIRRPNKPPTSGTQVYNAIARTGTGAAATVTGVGFAPDFGIIRQRISTTSSAFSTWDRLRGANNALRTNLTNAEWTAYTDALIGFDAMDGVRFGTDASANWVNANTYTYINWFFRRAPGVFDVVCYTGTGSSTAFNHGLLAIPELMLVKRRNSTGQWCVYFGDNTDYINLELANGRADDNTIWNDTSPTATTFTIGTNADVNTSGGLYVAYLFASLPGISKVFSYTGNGGTADSAGTSQTINCGFSAGARFVLIKCASHNSNWVVVDTARGLIAGNDPTLSLNTTAAEVTGQDLLDPANEGFVVNQLGSAAGTSANFNVTGRTYIGLAVA